MVTKRVQITTSVSPEIAAYIKQFGIKASALLRMGYGVHKGDLEAKTIGDELKEALRQKEKWILLGQEYIKKYNDLVEYAKTRGVVLDVVDQKEAHQ